ncbi:MAG: hypothetical protein RLZZ373_610, partial [Pseudomonadota bacterium]|jgi:hypothetical protein
VVAVVPVPVPVPEPEPTPAPTVEFEQLLVAGAGFDVASPMLRPGEPLTGAEDRTRLDQIMVAIAGNAGGIGVGRPGGVFTATNEHDGEMPLAASPSDLPSTLARTAPAPVGNMPDTQKPQQSTRSTTAQPEPAKASDPGRQTASELLVMLDVPIDLSGFVQDRMALLQWAMTDERNRAAADSALRQQAKDEAPSLRWDSGQAVQVGSMALSVGLVFWATRATGLVASLLAVAPPWRQFDPLPVLSVHAPRQPEGTEVEWLDTDITGSLAELAEDILDQRT